MYMRIHTHTNDRMHDEIFHIIYSKIYVSGNRISACSCRLCVNGLFPENMKYS